MEIFIERTECHYVYGKNNIFNYNTITLSQYITHSVITV